jgi:hypothetical protein
MLLITVFEAVFPVFALIFAGWLAARANILDQTATRVLNQFVIYMALPALLFIAMARTPIDQLAQPGFIATYMLGVGAAAASYWFLSRHDALDPIDRIINSMSAGYGNAGFMGIPLMLIVFGPEALAPSIICAVMTVTVQFGITIVCLELKLAQGKGIVPTLLKVGTSVIRNPLLVSPLLGILWSALGLWQPAAATRFLDLLGEASIPCALVAIGLFLAHTPKQALTPAVKHISVVKLFVHPIVVTILALWVFDMPAIWAWVAILTSALPLGTGPFMLSSLYKRHATTSAQAILVTTMISMVTLSGIVAWVDYLTLRP